MSARTTAQLAWSLCALTLSALVLVVILLGWSTPLPQGRIPWRDQAISLVGIIGAPVLGGLIASRRPGNSYGWLWLIFGLGLALQLLAESYAAYALVLEPGSLPAPRTISRLLALGGPLALAFIPFLLLCCSPQGCRRDAGVPWWGLRASQGRRFLPSPSCSTIRTRSEGRSPP